MFLARLPNDQLKIQVYEINDTELLVMRGPGVPLQILRECRAWRGDPVHVKRTTVLRTGGIAAIDRTRELAISRLREFQRREMIAKVA